MGIFFVGVLFFIVLVISFDCFLVIDFYFCYRGIVIEKRMIFVFVVLWGISVMVVVGYLFMGDIL